MKKIVLLLLLAVCGTMAAVGQISHTPQGDVDKNAQAILKKAAARFVSDAVSFNVTMVNYNAQKKETARQTASVLYRKGSYRVTLPDQVLISDAKSVWHWNKEANEVVVSTLDASSDDLMNPAKILSSYSKNFKPKYIRTESDGTAIIDLTPKKSMSYHKLRLFVNEKDGSLKKMEIHNYDSSRGEYIISNFKSKVKCGNNDFTFDKSKNPQVEIIDMR